MHVPLVNSSIWIWLLQAFSVLKRGEKRDLGNRKPPSLLAFEPAPKGVALDYLSSRYSSLLIETL
jgi:hypothetical protein